ncbi:MAG: ABC transporter ATP-binding protein/permease, partial [Lachnospiraceae bacterium]|nr:ABC transporter ATP-binding protein/permease [Lachnospiraceae bacterium]
EQTDRFSTGSLITRVTNDITQLQNLVMQCIRGFVRTFLLFVGGIASMLMLDLSFGVVVACALPLVIACAVFFLAKASPKFSILQENLHKVNHDMQEHVSGVRVPKAYVREEYEQERFDSANMGLAGTQLDVLLLFSYMTPIMNIILNISVAAVIKVGAVQVQAGGITPGNVMAAITYVTQILNAIMRMTMIFQTVSRGAASGKRIKEILDCAPAICDGEYDTSVIKADNAVKGKIEFRNVSFAYSGMRDERILKDISLVINPGETFAILGATGCGKSSFVNLIPRLYDVTSGQVLVDGIDVRSYPLKELRDKIAIALQKSEIFSSSIEENIRWGKLDADTKTLENAAKTAQAWEFI